MGLRTVRSVCARSGMVAAALAWATAEAAADGVIEINQARALAGGVTPGDLAGFPVTISQPGSYRLTSNLDRSGAALSARAIDIQSADVTLDLGGFAVLGAAVCTPVPVTGCTNTGNGDGIAAIGFDNVTIRNGTVRGQPRSGVVISGVDAVVEGVRAISNGRHGIDTTYAMVVGCEGSQNFEDGIVSGGTVQRSVARGNRSDGIAVAVGHVVHSHALLNGAFGLQTFNTISSYAHNIFVCNNSMGGCSNAAQVSNVTALQLSPNQCGTDDVCP